MNKKEKTRYYIKTPYESWASRSTLKECVRDFKSYIKCGIDSEDENVKQEAEKYARYIKQGKVKVIEVTIIGDQIKEEVYETIKRVEE